MPDGNQFIVWCFVFLSSRGVGEVISW